MNIKISFVKVRKFFLTFVFIAAAFTGGYFLGVQGFRAELTKSFQLNINREIPPAKNVDMSLFWQVWDTLGAKYYDKTKLAPSKMVYGAIEGMVSALGDPYTLFLPPAQNKVVNEDLSGSFEGVGIEIGYRNTHLAVIAPISGSPADKAGVKAGDYIVHIKDEKKGVDIEAQNIPINEAVANIRGPAGTVVTLTLVREGAPKEVVVDITRAKLDVPSVALSYVGKNSDIANIKLSRFGSETLGQWDKAVSDILQKPSVKGIVIDLRNNPGGYLQAAIDIASDFVPANTTVVVQQNGDGSREEFKPDRLERLGKYKVVILVNGGSASASEILSGALRDNRGIIIIGDKSFGKGTIQEPLDFPGGAGLHITTAKWLTPNGTWVHEKGIMPDIVVTPKEADTTDVQMEAAIQQFN